MERFSLKKSLLSAVVFSLLHAGAQSAGNLSITNPLNQERPDELVVLSRREVEKAIGPVGTGKFLSLTGKNGQPLVVQFDDNDGDGSWEEALFLYSFQPRETASFHLSLSADRPVIKAVVRAHLRLKKKNGDDSWGPDVAREVMPVRNPATDFSKDPLPPYLTEGPAWENDRVAFRLYLDVRNNKDIYGKRVSRMVMDSVGTVVHPSYHELHDWGMDILHVVKSLGAGALALSVPQPSGKDTLIRLGGPNVKNTIYQKLSDGPVRARFRMTYDWEVMGRPVQITEETGIWGGQYFYESRVEVKGAPEGTKLVSGIASFYDNVFQSFDAGSSQILLSHGKQSENFDNLGMAIMVPKADFAFMGSAPLAGSEILNTWLAAQKIRPAQADTFRFYVGWEKTDSSFASLDYFRALLRRDAEAAAQPLQLRWK